MYHKNYSGITLIEVMFSLLILSGIALTQLELQSKSLHWQQQCLHDYQQQLAELNAQQ